MKRTLPSKRHLAMLIASGVLLLSSISAKADGVYNHSAKFNFEEPSLSKKSGVLEIISDGNIYLESGTLDTLGYLITCARGTTVKYQDFKIKTGGTWREYAYE